MALGLNTESGGGDYAQIWKWDARAGRAFRVDRTQDASGAWQTDNVEITNGLQFLADMENLEVGWALFQAGVAPNVAYVKLPTDGSNPVLPPKPSADHKQAFRVTTKLGKDCGGDVREFGSQSKAVISAIDALHDAYTAGKAANPGKLPLVSLSSTKTITSQGKGQSSTNYAPVFEILRWIDRPADMPASGEAKASPPNDPLPKSEPVQPARSPEPAMADGTEF